MDSQTMEMELAQARAELARLHAAIDTLRPLVADWDAMRPPGAVVAEVANELRDRRESWRVVERAAASVLGRPAALLGADDIVAALASIATTRRGAARDREARAEAEAALWVLRRQSVLLDLGPLGGRALAWLRGAR